MKKRILSVLLAAAMVLTLLPGMAFAAEDEVPAAPANTSTPEEPANTPAEVPAEQTKIGDQDAAPDSKPTVNANTELYQVEIMCEVDHTHYWTYPSTVGWAHSSPDQFTVGEPRPNDLDNGTAEQYPYICPVTSAYTLDECVAKVNAKYPGHQAVTTEEELPVAYYYWNAEEGWVLLRTKEANPQVRFAGAADDPKEGTLEIKISCAERPGQPEPDPDDSDKPTSKPTVGNAVLYQVDILCQKHVDSDPDCTNHWWSHAETSAAFTVGDIQKNTTGYQEDTYKWVCPVTPAKDLNYYLTQLNNKAAGHKLVSDKLPTAWFFWDGTSWTLPKEANSEVRFGDNNVGSLSIYATCEGGEEPDPGPVDPTPSEGEPVWLTNMNIMGYDLFTKGPEKLPDTADGKYLVLARSGVEGDTDVYALYLNPAPCAPNNAVVAGQGVTAAKLAMEDDELVGYLAGTETKVTLDQLLITIEAAEGGFTFSNGDNYLCFGGPAMVGAAAAITVSSRPGVSGAYLITAGNRKLTLYVAEQHNYNAAWKTNFWGPQGDMGQGAAGTMGSSYIYFLHTHVEDGKTVAAFDSEGQEIQDVGGYLTIPGGGRIEVDGEVTFTVPDFVQEVYLHKNYASSLVMDGNGGFGVMGCTITMQDGSTTSSISRSGSAGTGVTFARTADNRLYFGGEGEMTNFSSRNTDVPAWLDSLGDRTLKSVFIGGGVTSVGSNAFKFTALSDLTLSDGLEIIGDSAFESCRIDSIEIPGTVTDIGANAFKGCLDLRSIELPESVISIGANAFANCTRLRNVTFAGSLGSIPSGAFQAMSGYSRLNLVFLADAPASAYSDYEGMLPFLHQNCAIVYTQSAPSASLVASGGTDAYFANLNGASLSGIELLPGVLPTLRAKGGQAFTGWQVGNTTAAIPGGSAVSGQPAGTVFTAQWGGEYTVACTVTIDGVGYTVAQGQTMGAQMPADPTREGMRFTGWVDANGEPFTADTPIAGNIVVTSTWTEIPTYTVTFDANGGVLAGRGSITVLEGDTLTLRQIPNITRSGYTFDGWFTESGGRFTGAAITGDMTLTARWTEEGAQPETPSVPSGGGGGVSRPSTPVTPEQPPVEVDDPEVPLAQLTFVDVGQDAWYAGAVAYVFSKNLMKGVSEISFAPDSTLSRGMMAQIIYNAAGQPKVSGKAPFTDMKSGVYYTDAVAWGVENHLIAGYSGTVFGGEDIVTREQAVVMLYRYAQSLGLAKDVDLGVLDTFSDCDKISGWAEEAVAWAVENGLLQGRGNKILDPSANITRAEAAAILERYAKLFLA